MRSLPLAQAASSEAALGVPEQADIILRGVGKRFQGSGLEIEALRQIDLDIAPREFVCVLGPSGCGKSTLLRVMGGLEPPTAGEVRIQGRPPEEAQRTKQIGFVFQAPALLPWRTVLANVELPLEVNRRHNRARPYGSVELLDLVGLTDFAGAYPHQLSGGMQQRVAIARALAFYPSILLMDEPFGALDQITRDALRYELLRIWTRTRKTVVFVTHSISEAIVLSDRVLVMAGDPGRIRAVLPIDLPRPRGEEVEQSNDFLAYAARLKELLR